MNKIKIALIGNPNCGKSTFFNQLSGYRQKVGNYPGITVEKKEGFLTYEDLRLTLVDLPGLYSLTPSSEEETAASDFLIGERPDVIINIVDASNLEKSLFLTSQLMEMDIPIVIALNMIDVAKEKKIDIDTDWLASMLEVKIVPTIGNKKEGLKKVLETAVALASKKEKFSGINFKFSSELEDFITSLSALFEEKLSDKEKRWLAIKMLESDKKILEKIKNEKILDFAGQAKKHMEEKHQKYLEIIMAKERYDFIFQICQKAIRSSKEYPQTKSDKIDQILTHPIWGIPILGFFMFLMFFLTFTLGAYPTFWLQKFFLFLSKWISGFWKAPTILHSLIVNGIIGGVGSIITFLPNILILFFCIALLEETGYMARVAFLMDRIMHKIGLHGKSFIPLLIGFGCSVPAIMATRVLENRKERLITILALPLIACSAKLVVFTLIIPAFFPTYLQGVVLFSLYLIGILLAILVIKILKKIFYKEESVSFIMELPRYKVPRCGAIFSETWTRGGEYIKRAGTYILAFSILIWLLSFFPKEKEDYKPSGEKVAASYVGKIGKSLDPIFKPLGFDWKINSSLIASFAGKEVFVSQLGIIYSLGKEDPTLMQKELKRDYSSWQAFAIMLFILISMPCFATIVITKKETKSWKWAFFQFFGLTLLAYFITLIVYQLGKLFIG